VKTASTFEKPRAGVRSALALGLAILAVASVAEMTIVGPPNPCLRHAAWRIPLACFTTDGSVPTVENGLCAASCPSLR
jgi:hypothetical protein